MTAEAALDAVDQCDPDLLADILIAMSEKERRALHSALIEHAHADGSVARDEDLNRCRVLIALGAGIGSDIGKRYLPWPYVPYIRPADVLATRPQRTIDAIVTALLKSRFNDPAWWTVRELVQRGTIQRPDDEDYFVGLVPALSLAGQAENRRLKELAESGVPQESGAIVVLRNDEALPAEMLEATKVAAVANRPWTQVFQAGVDAGVWERAVILDLGVDGQLRDLRKSASASYRKLFESLAPTLEEKEQRAQRLIRITSAGAPAEQAAAAKVLRELARDGREIDAAAIASAVVSPLSGTHKGAAIAALRLLADAGLSVADCAQAAVHGLGHPHLDVQSATLKLLEASDDDLPAAVRSEALLWVDSVAPSLRDRVVSLVGLDTPMQGTADASGDFSARYTAFAGCPVPATNLDELLAVAAQDEMPGALAFDPGELVDNGNPVEPITDIDELVTALTMVLAGTASPLDLERVIDGLSRADRSAIPDSALSPVRAMFRKGYERYGWNVSYLESAVEVAARCWHDQRMPEGEPADNPSIIGRLTARLHEAVTNGLTSPTPTLALPTSTGGWVDELALTERLAEHERRGLTPRRGDAVQALLRLRPSGSSQRLGNVASIGADASPVGLAIDRFRGADVEIADRDLEAAVNETTQVRAIKQIDSRTNGWGDVFSELIFEFTQPTPTAANDDPTRQLWAPKEYPGSAAWSRLITDWTIIGFPRHRDIVAARMAGAMTAGLDMVGPDHQLHSHISAAVDPDLPLGFGLHLLLAVGLADRVVASRAAAGDLLHDAAIDGRLDAQLLGEILSTLSNGGVIKAARFAAAMASVVPFSPLVAERVREVLSVWLANLAGLPRDLFATLELLELACAGSGTGVNDARAITKLTEAAAGSSKRAKSARRILELQNGTSPLAPALAGHALIARAERWTATT